MLLSTLKCFLFCAAVLLLGQIRVGERSVGEHFHGVVKAAAAWGEGEIKESPLYARLAGSSIFSRWLNNVYPPKGGETPAAAVEEKAPDPVADSVPEPDTFNTSDRESILRLLD